jgi:hypothetical protein
MMKYSLPHEVNTSQQPCPAIAVRIKWSTADV